MNNQSAHYKTLKNRWLKRHNRVKVNLWKKHGSVLNWLQESSKQIAVGSLASFLLFTTPVTSTLFAQLPSKDVLVNQSVPQKDLLRVALKNVLPDTVMPLTDEQEVEAAKILSQAFNMQVAAELDGKRLNRSYGLIGKEQHLVRYPGDNLATHFSDNESALYADSGMAPGRGAWGYWANSASDLTAEQIQQEKYYIAVQTFLAPGWSENSRDMYAFFKYRKMLVVNPDNGKAVVAVIGDAGPGQSTGKHVGGSPEVMAYLERVDGAQKGPVLYFFIDDPDNAVPLGPIEVQ